MNKTITAIFIIMICATSLLFANDTPIRYSTTEEAIYNDQPSNYYWDDQKHLEELYESSYDGESTILAVDFVAKLPDGKFVFIPKSTRLISVSSNIFFDNNSPAGENKKEK